MSRKEKVEMIQSILRMGHYNDIPTFSMLCLLGVVIGFAWSTVSVHKPGFGLPVGVGVVFILGSVTALMVRLHLLRRSLDTLADNLTDLEYALSRMNQAHYPDLETLANKFFASVKEKRQLEQMLPADEEDPDYAEIHEKLKGVSAEVERNKYDFWVVYNWYDILKLKLPSDRISGFRTTTKSAASA